MRIAVVSMIREAWGGSEELWAAMAKKAMEQGHTVDHSTLVADPDHPKIRELISLGMHDLPRPGIVKAAFIPHRVLLKSLLRLHTLFESPYQKLLARKPDVVLYVGTTYSIAEDFVLVKALKKGK